VSAVVIIFQILTLRIQGSPNYPAVSLPPPLQRKKETRTRIFPDGSVTQRNLGGKDNLYSSLDLRFTKGFPFGAYKIAPALDIFNLFNSKNFHRPEVTNLIFNFDGAVQRGVGEPRRLQLWEG
jgi:hypothetical protein